MAWQFYAIDNDCRGFSVKARGELFGPFAKRRWIPETGRKKYKRNKSYIAPFAKTSDSEMDRKAATYARWIATRDNIALPVDVRKVSAHWAGIDNETSGKWEKRIRAVTFGHGSNSVTIDLPNWDWQPVMTEEHETELQLAA